MKVFEAFFLIFQVYVVCARAEFPKESKLNTEVSGSFPFPPLPIKLIISDIDGTLMDRSGTFFNPNILGFRLAQLLGIKVAFATGRSMRSVLDFIGKETLQKIGYFGSPGVYLNGSYVVDPDGRVIRDIPLKPDLLEHILDVLESENVLTSSIGVSDSGYIYYKGGKDMQKVYKVHVEGNPETISTVRKRLQEELGEQVAFTQSHNKAFEVMMPGFDKGEGVKLLAAELGVSPDEVLVLGNADNDLPMFRVAGTAVSVEDGYEEAKEAADYVTVKHTEGALFYVVRDIMRYGHYPNYNTITAAAA